MKHSFWTGFLKQAGAVEVACIAVVNGDKILMGKRKDNGKWTNPGGHMDPGETPVEGAIRELKEESGIVATPEDLEHLKTKVVTKPDGTKLTIHGFKLDQGKHKTSVKGDPDEEVHRWVWKSIPLPADVAENLHVQKDNVLLDALKIDYPQEKKASFYDAVMHHMSQDEGTQPAPATPKPAEEKIPPHEKTEQEETPEETKTAALRRLKLRTADAKTLSNQFAQYLAQRENPTHDHRGDHVAG